ncbi:putative gamma interferon inducible lysosomal thiol reductase GILT [Rosa chinensis]|uniref:Putative gamma interferon inducible lysosomal thiol reductase GILT n=1 Tax=Rosa chinensis TaxID=74649 RepID=A0A2P6R8R2_ROSCH|nr:putative gamma interferon inducible lysosomal thiol reductase GILT [Rosa chinensis]
MCILHSSTALRGSRCRTNTVNGPIAFKMSKLGTVPIDCYNSGYGNQDYKNFMAYICKAYKGKSPEACRSIRYKTESIGNEKSISQVCLAEQGRNSTY